MIYFITFLVLIFLIYFQAYLFLFPKNRLLILMYHRVETASTEDLTVSVQQLENQFRYLQGRRYKSKFFSEIQHRQSKSIILTFDDGYRNNLEFLPALLEKYHLKATIFIPTKFIQEGYENYPMMSFGEIKSLNRNYFEIGLHSHSHQNFRNISAETIKKDLQENMKILQEHEIPYTSVLAYPYGKYPKKNPRRQELFTLMKDLGIKYAVRIGNKINYIPTSRPYELCRIDIKGSDSMATFRLKLLFGKLKLF